MKDEDLDQLVADEMLMDYEFVDNPFDCLTLIFPNGKRMRIESLAEDAASVLLVNLE
jgi:hypothetical protein